MRKDSMGNKKAISNLLRWLFNEEYGVMDIFHAGIGPKAIYCLYLQGINAMNQKTALFVVTNIQRRMDAN